MIGTDRLRGAVFLLSGVVLLIAAAIVAKSTADFLHHSQFAAGLVVAEPYGPHHVTIQFHTNAGRKVTYHQNGAITLHKGEAVMVRYDPRDPTGNRCVDRFGAIWGAAVILVLMGGVFMGTGASLLRSEPEGVGS